LRKKIFYITGDIVILMLVNSSGLANLDDKRGNSHLAFTNNFLRNNIGENVMKQPTEIFKPIVTKTTDYTGLYEVSDKGRVKSLSRVIMRGGRRYVPGDVILKPYFGDIGYPTISLFMNGVKKKYYIHRLVGLMFIPNPGDKPQINHKDFDRTNNNKNNLEWVSSSQNVKHGHTKIDRKKITGHKISEATKKKIGDSNRGLWVEFLCDYCGNKTSKREREYLANEKHFCNMDCYVKSRGTT